MNNFPKPTTLPKLQQYLGMVNYYHKFLPNIANILSPLYKLLKGKPKVLTWDQEAEKAFQKSKSALSHATTLTFPNPKAQLQLSTDASESAIGAVIEQVINGKTQPLAFFSKKLNAAQIKYSTFDRELLAIYEAVRYFQHYLEGSEFTIKTDHQPIVHAFSRISDTPSNRQRRHLSYISEFNCKLMYVPGTKNPVADALSRNTIHSVILGIDYKELAEKQTSDPEIKALRNATTSLIFEDLKIPNSNITITCDISTGKPRPIVPTDQRKEVFNLIHGLSHPSIRSTSKLIKEKFMWLGISKDITKWTKTCQKCQMSKITKHTTPHIGSLPQPKRRFADIHVDIVGPLPYSNGYRYLFTAIDRSTRWPEAYPIPDATSESCARSVIQWISRYGVPENITSDRGTPFTSQLWSSLTKLIGTKPHTTTAYHPQANGLIERFHRSLKASLMASCDSDKWFYQLPWVLLGLRTTPKEDTPQSPAERVYGEALTVPGEFFPATQDNEDLQILRNKVGNFAPFIPTHTDRRKTYVPNTLKDSTHAFIRVDSHRSPLTKPYVGPYQILQRRPHAYKMEVKGTPDWISIERLKPAYLQTEDTTTYSRAGRRIIKKNIIEKLQLCKIFQFLTQNSLVCGDTQ